MSLITSRAIAVRSSSASVRISPEITTRFVLTRVSQATRASSPSPWAMTASSTASEIWSETLSGCPSVTDSEVNRNSFSASGAVTGAMPPEVLVDCLLDGDEQAGAQLVVARIYPHGDRVELTDVVA